VRTCMEGPVFNGARVWWDRWMGETDQPSLPVEPAHPSEVAEAWRS
jgi:hypothetical protein